MKLKREASVRRGSKQTKQETTEYKLVCYEDWGKIEEKKMYLRDSVRSQKKRNEKESKIQFSHDFTQLCVCVRGRRLMMMMMMFCASITYLLLFD